MPPTNTRNSRDSQDWNEAFGIYLHRRRLEILSTLLQGWYRSTALDVGCGEGLLVGMGVSEAIGIDVRPSDATTVYASAEFLPFRAGSFDLLFAGEVIEHLERPRDALEDWIRVLRTGGTIIVSTPNGVLVKPEGGNPEHKHTFAPSEVRKRLEALGLRVDYSKGVFTGLLSGKRVFRVIRPIRLKMAILRFPVPLSLSYDVFIRARKQYPHG